MFIHKPNGNPSTLYIHEEEFYETGFQASALLIESGVEIKLDVIKESKNHYKVIFANDSPDQKILFTLSRRLQLNSNKM